MPFCRQDTTCICMGASVWLALKTWFVGESPVQHLFNLLPGSLDHPPIKETALWRRALVLVGISILSSATNSTKWFSFTWNKLQFPGWHGASGDYALQRDTDGEKGGGGGEAGKMMEMERERDRACARGSIPPHRFFFSSVFFCSISTALVLHLFAAAGAGARCGATLHRRGGRTSNVQGD